MSHKLTRLSKSILEQPQLITASKFEEIAEVLENRNKGLYKEADSANLIADKESSSGLVADKVGVLKVEGPTTYKPSGFEALCGGCSYVDLIHQMENLCSIPELDTILMMINSGGGEAYRCFESARTLRTLADASGKKIIAYIDGMAASAAYGLASAAHEIVINPDAEAGSIGVVIRLQNNNKQQEEAGVKTTYITAGASKVPFDDEGEFRTEFLDGLQERVSELYDGFVSHVASMRGINDKVVRSTEAKMFSAEKALALGLVDKIMEGAEFNEYLADASAKNESVPSLGITPTLETKKENLMSDNVTAEANAELVSQMEAMSKQLAHFQAKELAAEKSQLSASFDSIPFVADCKADLVSFLMSDTVSADHKVLMNTIISSATNLNNEVVENAATQVTEAQAAATAAEAEKEAIKEEFGTKEYAVNEELKEEVSGSNILADKIKAKKAALAATK
jgi:signal peptide peptidase SppA